MTRASPTPELLAVARRMVWFKSAEETLRNDTLFLNHLMTYGTMDDLAVARRFYDREDFREALRRALPGVFDLRSWAYWHAVLGMGPAPPLPVRELE